MSKPKILVDCDGVLADLDGYLWDCCLEAGVRLDISSRDEQTKYLLTDHIPDPWHRGAIRDFIDGSRVFKDLPVLEGAQDGMNELSKVADVWICTKPLDTDRWCLYDKRNWVEKHFPEFVEKLILCSDKSMIKADMLLDDAPAIDWIIKAEWEPVVYNQPHNMHKKSVFYDFPHWDWSRPLNELLNHIGER